MGDWLNGVANGTGEFAFGSGVRKGQRYAGSFLNGQRHGFGTYYYPNGDSFVGSFKVTEELLTENCSEQSSVKCVKIYVL